jgi:hypothetical protein
MTPEVVFLICTLVVSLGIFIVDMAAVECKHLSQAPRSSQLTQDLLGTCLNFRSVTVVRFRDLTPVVFSGRVFSHAQLCSGECGACGCAAPTRVSSLPIIARV